MRSRFDAYVALDVEYLLATWHPSTRPASLVLDPAVRWLRLEILAAERGKMLDTAGTVEFRAHYRGGSLHETSRFVKVDRQWFYVDGDVD
jgi:SEC-C motif-containing protein